MSLLRMLGILLICFGFQMKAGAQKHFLYTGKTDSVILSTYSFFNKELSSPGDTSESERVTLLGTSKLTDTEITTLNKRLGAARAVTDQWALLYHFNIVICYYISGVVVQHVTISQLTNNITMRKITAGLRYDTDLGSVTEGQLVQQTGQMSRSLQRYIAQLLQQNQL